MKKLLRLLCLLCCLALLPAPALQEGAAAPDVRVQLARLGLTDRMDLVPRGRYLLRAGSLEYLLPENQPLSLLLREGRLVLHGGSTALTLGDSVSLLRLDTSGGIPSLTVEGQSGFYPGDLTVTAAEGKLQAVLTLSVEDYLLGVVPNEMSERFPPEALKAQAVCARTYVLSRCNPKKAWDVVDTTNDQVFRGVDTANVNAARAVSETAGLVITSGGKLAEGYYSASNGGQTELPSRVWDGRSAASCYAVTDDPYDVENPDSLVRSAELKRDGSNLYKAFLRVIRKALPGAKQTEDGKTDISGFKVEEIQAVRLITPRYEAPCRLMTEMEITVSVSGDVTGTHTLKLSLFPDVMYALGLRISFSSNELVTVTETADGFRLEARRFGHGVGLSQRGAQWMASAYGKSFTEILEFYFPGMALKQLASGRAALPTPNPVLAETPGPLPTAAPRPTLMPVSAEALPEGAYLASVENIADDSSLNLRAEPTAAASIVMRLYRHQRLIVLEDDEVPGWAHVRTDSAEGYVMTSFLERINP